jgi:hypothetical protein
LLFGTEAEARWGELAQVCAGSGYEGARTGSDDQATKEGTSGTGFVPGWVRQLGKEMGKCQRKRVFLDSRPKCGLSVHRGYLPSQMQQRSAGRGICSAGLPLLSGWPFLSSNVATALRCAGKDQALDGPLLLFLPCFCITRHDGFCFSRRFAPLPRFCLRAAGAPEPISAVSCQTFTALAKQRQAGTSSENCGNGGQKRLSKAAVPRYCFSLPFDSVPLGEARRSAEHSRCCGAVSSGQ